MIDHISIGVRDLAASAAFYERVLAEIGFEKLTASEETVGFGKKYPEFWLNARPAMKTLEDGSGTHICLRARSEEAVSAFHKAALGGGGRDDGAPGLRPQYSAGYYAAFIRDLDGYRIEVVSFVAGK